MGLQVLAPYGADATVLRAAAALEQRLALPKGTEPRRGSAELRTEGPRTTVGWGSSTTVILVILRLRVRLS